MVYAKLYHDVSMLFSDHQDRMDVNIFSLIALSIIFIFIKIYAKVNVFFLS
jgi:hypothetical protein